MQRRFIVPSLRKTQPGFGLPSPKVSAASRKWGNSGGLKFRLLPGFHQASSSFFVPFGWILGISRGIGTANPSEKHVLCPKKPGISNRRFSTNFTPPLTEGSAEANGR